jgi:acetyl-CoA synthetase
MIEKSDFAGDLAGADVVWTPSPENVSRSNLKAFMDRHSLSSFEELIERSADDVEWFTEAVLEFLDIRFQHPYSKILDISGGIQFPRWCVDGQLNITSNCTDKWMGDRIQSQRTALICEAEDGTARHLTYAELGAEVNRCANALRSLGFGRGDPIALFLPMTQEIVVALLAIARIGAVVLPMFSGFGAGAIRSRLQDAAAAGLITADGQHRRGGKVGMKQIADEAIEGLSSIRHVVVVNITDLPIAMESGRDLWWHDVVRQQSAVADFQPTSAEDLLMIIYTSGTTGKPKGAVHTHCGFPIKAAQDMCFGTDVQPGEVIYWVTDMGWMMGPWLVLGSCLLGATCVVYEGALDYPEADRLWRMVEKHQINVLGVSPTLIRSLKTHGDELPQACDLSSIRAFASTGEPWNPDSWMWLFDAVGRRRRPIINYSGGTEISGGIIMGTPLHALKPASFSAPCPGLQADVVDERGESVRDRVGELVVRKPWIGMTRGFWKDDERYLRTYWSRWPDIWVHGDWAMATNDGDWWILGRSDDTINVAGKRLGPAEFESVLVSHADVVEAGAIGIPHEIKGTELICFCVLRAGAHLDGLKNELMEQICAELGRPLKPGDIFFVADLPKTRNAKVMRRVIRGAFLGEELGDITSLVNPESVEAIRAAGRVD